MEHFKTKQKSAPQKTPNKQQKNPNKPSNQTNQQANTNKKTMKATEPEYSIIQSINLQEKKEFRSMCLLPSSKKGSGIQK